MKICPYCSTQNPDDSVFCLSCGQNMSVAPAPAPAPVAPEPTAYQPQQPPAQTYVQPPQAPPSGFTAPPQQYAPPTYQAPVQPYQGAGPGAAAAKPPKTGNASKNWAGILGMILGILSLVLCCIPYLSPFFAVGGLIFSIMGLKSQQRGMSIAGLITSILGTIIAIAYIIIIATALTMPAWLDEYVNFNYSF
ncbi:MAG: hypothetical protein FWG21_03920 [Oscillospiraceae bacterium]|nr:hypothetical protein [Oscillospiraceae bacterium]